MKYKPTIGLEIHIELKTRSKMFCSCFNDSNERHPNVNVCPICMGHPGTLPVINEGAVGKVIKTGLALNCQILENSQFDRKNYFYPDLPKGYQISQLYQPFCREGFLEINGKKIRIREIHLEEDTGKLLHPEGEDCSLVDFNRAGTPLMELATEPDIASSKEAREFAEELQLIVRYLGVSDADMEKGQLRVEPNISLGFGSKLGTKVELKNLNSFRSVERGIEYEIDRQTEILEGGKKVIQETRGWNENKGLTFSQRIKEEAHDYRYFPEPDLPPLKFANEKIKEIASEIPELPLQKRIRFKEEYKLGDAEIGIFVFNKRFGEYFEKTMSELRQWIKDVELKDKVKEDEFFKLTKLCSNYLTSDLRGLLKGFSVADENFKITPENFAEFVTLIYEGIISSKIAKMVLEEMVKTGGDPSHIIKEKDLIQLTDDKEIEKIVREIIEKNPKTTEDYKKGKANALQFLVGQVMAATKGKASPEIVNNILKRIL